MKNWKLLLFAVQIFGLLNGILANAQSTGYVKQVITVNSGRFEYNPPYIDYVTVQAYNPENGNVNPFNTIYTQSGQAIVSSDKIAFVAAQDSIIKYDINSMQRLGAVRDSGLCQLALVNGRLVVSKQYPIVNHFVEVLDTANMDVVAQITGISGDCGGITMIADTVYVAVNEGWMGTNGKFAIIDPNNWTLKAELDFGTDAVGIFNLYNYNGKIVSINKTPYGITNAGSVTIYNPSDRTFNNVLLTHTIGSGAGIKDNLLYMIMDYGIGSFNLNTLSVEDSVIIKDPGSSVFKYFTSTVIDTIDNRIYANIGDYMNSGTCLVTSLTGDSITTFITGISSDAIAIDYRFYPTGVTSIDPRLVSVKVYPNPVIDKLNLTISNNHEVDRLFIVNNTGRMVVSINEIGPFVRNLSIPFIQMASGLYFLVLESSGTRSAISFIKQ